MTSKKSLMPIIIRQTGYKPGYVPNKKNGVCHLSWLPLKGMQQPTPRKWTSNP